MRQTFQFFQRMKTENFSLMIFGLSCLWLSFPYPSSLGQAQDSPITSSGLSTQVNETIAVGGQTQYNITGGTRPGGTSGTNLFHSFGTFGVPSDNIANFLNGVSFDLDGNPLAAGLPTSNILARVTGNFRSEIFGTIQTSGFENSNFFLMNPAGFLFGPTATVDVGGSVAFTSADYLRLAELDTNNAGIFHADLARVSILTNSPVAAFGFLGPNPGAITVQGSQFTLTEGSRISLVGGSITIESGTLDSGASQIDLASATSQGEYLAGTFEQAPNISAKSFDALGEVRISQKSLLDVSGSGGGSIIIRGGQFIVNDSMIFANVTGPGITTDGVESIGRGIEIDVTGKATIENGAVIDTSVFGNATPDTQYGGVRVNADRLDILGSQDFENLPETAIFSNVIEGSTGGNSGDIKLEANSILMRDFGTETTVLNASTEGVGNSGSINLTSQGNLELDLAGIFTDSSSASGNAGKITLSSTQGKILLNETIVISQASRGEGMAGFMSLSAPQGDILLDTSQFGNRSFLAGGLGTIDIGATKVSLQVTAKNLQLNDSSISGDNFDLTPAGKIVLTLDDNLNLRDSSFIQTVSRGRANAADLNITAHDVTIADNSFLSTETRSSGRGGQLNILTEHLRITDGGQIRSGSLSGRDPLTGTPIIPSGSGGTVNIQGLASPAESVLINGAGSGIFTNTVGTGTGGNINILANTVTLQNGGVLSAATSGTSPSATGGSILVNATDHVTMTGGASITTSSTDPDNPNAGLANAGNISISAGQQFEMRNSSVTAEAKQASGGNIDIRAVDRIRLINSEINSSVQGGPTTVGGNITIDPNVVVLQHSQVIAQAVQGAGGNITITTPLFLADSSSLVNASSQFGVNGTVTIQSPTSNLSESLGTLPSEPSQGQTLLTQRCAALANGQASSFVVAGREQLPADPGGWLSSPLAFAAFGESLDEGHAVASTPAIMTKATQDTGTVSLRRLTPAGFLVANFADSEATGCHS